MNYKQLCEKIDFILKTIKKDQFVMIESVKNNKGLFVCSGRTKMELSGGMVSFKLKNGINDRKFYITIL